MSGSSAAGSTTVLVNNIPAWAATYAELATVASENLSNVPDLFLYLNKSTGESLPTFAEQGVTYSVNSDNPNNITITKNLTAYDWEAAAETSLIARGSTPDPGIVSAKTHLDDVLSNTSEYLAGTKNKFVDIKTLMSSNGTTEYTANVYSKIGRTIYDSGDLSTINLAQDMADYGTPSNTKHHNRVVAEVNLDNYGSERQHQASATSKAIPMGRQAYLDAELLRKAGLYKRMYSQGVYDEAYKLWYEARVGEVARLEILGNTVRMMVGSHRASTQPFFKPSPVGSTLGGAMSGAATGYSMGGTGYGAAIGGIIGAVAGYSSSQ